MDAGVTVVKVINMATNRRIINKYMTSHDDAHFPVFAVPVMTDAGRSCCKLSLTHVQLL